MKTSAATETRYDAAEYFCPYFNFNQQGFLSLFWFFRLVVLPFRFMSTEKTAGPVGSAVQMSNKWQ